MIKEIKIVNPVGRIRKDAPSFIPFAGDVKKIMTKKVFGFKMIDKETCDDLEKFNKKLNKYLDKPGKCKTCDNKAVSSSGHCLACLTSRPDVKDTKPIKEIKKIEWNFAPVATGYRLETIENKVNQIIETINLLIKP